MLEEEVRLQRLASPTEATTRSIQFPSSRILTSQYQFFPMQLKGRWHASIVNTVGMMKPEDCLMSKHPDYPQVLVDLYMVLYSLVLLNAYKIGKISLRVGEIASVIAVDTNLFLPSDIDYSTTPLENVPDKLISMTEGNRHIILSIGDSLFRHAQIWAPILTELGRNSTSSTTGYSKVDLMKAFRKGQPVKRGFGK